MKDQQKGARLIRHLLAIVLLLATALEWRGVAQEEHEALLKQAVTARQEVHPQLQGFDRRRDVGDGNPPPGRNRRPAADHPL